MCETRSSKLYFVLLKETEYFDTSALFFVKLLKEILFAELLLIAPRQQKPTMVRKLLEREDSNMQR